VATDPLWRLKSRLNLRGNLRRVLPLIDIATAIPTGLAALYFFAMKRLGLNEMGLNKRVLERIGIWPVRRHYYEPYFDRTMVRRPLDEPRDLPGLKLNTELSLGLIEKLSAYGEEPLIGPVAGDRSYVPENGTYGLPDAALLYAMLRTIKPRRLIEVGGGNSTLVAMKALGRNREEGHETDHLCIEPFEMPWLEQAGARVHRAMVEDVDPAMFEELGSGDVLFVDNSHMIRPQGDVLTVIQQILPRLRPGVIVHIHDLLTPRDYPREWLLRDRTMWNEQYVVEAFLTWNDEYEILFAANHIYVDHRDAFDRIRPELAGRQWHTPTAFWLRRKTAEADPLLGA
jgi:hypothetical protein